MIYPTIYESRYGDPDDFEFTKCDAKINSGMIKEAVKHFDQYSKDITWRVRIEDKHDDEEKPHYILDVGHKFYGQGSASLRPVMVPLDLFKDIAVSIEIRYCDNHSCEPNIIAQKLGVATIWVCKRSKGQLVHKEATMYHARKIADEYVRLLDDCLPDYFITTWISEE